jgi:hypothetical protein
VSAGSATDRNELILFNSEMGIDLEKFDRTTVQNGVTVTAKREKADHTIRVLRPRLYSKVGDDLVNQVHS